MTRRLLLIASALTLSTLASGAYADVCSSLQQQYLNAGSGNNDVQSLARSLQAAQGAAQANRCGGGIFGGLFGGMSPSCPAIQAEIYRLQTALRAASGNRGFGPSFSYVAVSPRDQIRAALQANGCSIPLSGSGSYKTVCVRVCDGYYFPIEYGVGSNRFQADSQMCQSMYGGSGAAQLFVMPSDGDVADATPLGGGKRYGSQPFAFAYRKAFDKTCASQLKTTDPMFTPVIAIPPSSTQPATGTNGITTAALTPRPTELVPVPAQRPSRFEDPETVANAAGRLDPNAPRASAPDTSIRRDGVRVVGADYYNLILQQQAAIRPNAPEPQTPATGEAPTP